jgi:hypothetical protein
MRKSLTNMLLDFLLVKNDNFSLTLPRVFCHTGKRKPLYAKREMMEWQFRLSCRNIIFYFPFSCDVTLPSKWSETLTELALLVRVKRYGFGILLVAWCDVCVCLFVETSVFRCVIQSFIHAFCSVLRQVRSLVQNSSLECIPVLPLSISSILSFP